MSAIKESYQSRNWLRAGSLLLLSFTTPLNAQPLFTSAPASPSTGASPRSVAVGDFNGDGKQDLVTVNTDSNDVTVLLGNGTGRFTAVTGSPSAIGTSPRSVAVGDINGDGKQDLVIANANSNTVTLLLGDGAGAFTPATASPVAVGASPACVAIGDYNGDGRPDLAIANSASNNVTVLLGNGTGGFTQAPGSPFPVGTNPQSLVVGDFTGDRKPDLAIANAGGNTITVLRGNGAGAFTATGSLFPTGVKPLSLAVGDFSRDGKLDLATANAADKTVTVLLRNGAGGFTAATHSPIAIPSSPVSVAVADFNGDGKLDLATANSEDGTVTVLLGDGAGGFSAAMGSPFAVGSAPSSVAVGDFNGDGKPDLAVALSGDSAVALLLNTTPAYSSVFRGATGNSFRLGAVNAPHSTAVGDFNNDGTLDLAVAYSGSDNVAVMLGNSAGGFTPAPGSPFAAGDAPHGLAVGDFNRDGNLDLVTSNYWDATITVLLGNGAGGFTAAPGSPFPAGGYNPLWVAVADFNGDGKLDVATVNLSGASVLLGNGMGGFAQAPGSPFRTGSLPQSVAAGDFNNDGKPDLVFAGIGNVTVLLGNGTGAFEQHITYIDYDTTSATIGDFNGDGRLDVAITFYQPGIGVAVLLGNGSGEFTPAPGSPFALGSAPEFIAAADFNRDGKLDLITLLTSGDLIVLLGSGTGGFAAAPGSPFTTGTYPAYSAVGDFNRDGKLDLAVVDSNDQSVRVLLNTPLQSIAISPATASVAAGQTRQFTATGAYSDNSTLDLTAFVAWSSSHTWVATMGSSADKQGTATGVSGGPTTITAALAGLSATASLSVSGPTLQSITVSPATGSVVRGATQQFTATGRYSDNSTKDLTATVTWSSSSTDIASISNSTGSQGVATGVSPGGPVTITATLDGAAGISPKASLTVSAQSVTSNVIWGVNAGGQIYHLNGNWTLIARPSDKTPVQVSAADGTVWALDSDGSIYSWTGSSWQIVPGTLRQVSIGSADNVWGVNSTNTIYRWNGSSWVYIPGPVNRTPKEVSAATDGTVWSLDSEGSIYSYTGSGWQAIPGTLAQVSAGSRNNVWGVNAAGAIYQWNGTSWISVPGPASRISKQVSVGADGTVYLIDSLGNIYVRSGSAWQQLSGQLIQISAG